MKIVENRKEAAAKDNRSIVLKSYSTVISLDFDGYWNINNHLWCLMEKIPVFDKPLIRPYPSVLDFWKIKFQKSSSMN